MREVPRLCASFFATKASRLAMATAWRLAPRVLMTARADVRALLAKDNLFKVATVTGATKSGKTVLVKKVFKGERPIWVDGGSVSSLDDFLASVANELDIPAEEEETSGTSTTSGISERSRARPAFR